MTIFKKEEHTIKAEEFIRDAMKTNYIDVIFKKDGNISVFVGSERERLNKVEE